MDNKGQNTIIMSAVTLIPLCFFSLLLFCPVYLKVVFNFFLCAIIYNVILG